MDFEDYNNDGWPDVIITDLANQKYALYANAGDGSFDYTTLTTGWARSACCTQDGASASSTTITTAGKIYSLLQSHVMDTIQVNEPHLRYREPPMLLWNDHGKRFEMFRISREKYSTSNGPRAAWRSAIWTMMGGLMWW